MEAGYVMGGGSAPPSPTSLNRPGSAPGSSRRWRGNRLVRSLSSTSNNKTDGGLSASLSASASHSHSQEAVDSSPSPEPVKPREAEAEAEKRRKKSDHQQRKGRKKSKDPNENDNDDDDDDEGKQRSASEGGRRRRRRSLGLRISWKRKKASKLAEAARDANDDAQSLDSPSPQTKRRNSGRRRKRAGGSSGGSHDFESPSTRVQSTLFRCEEAAKGAEQQRRRRWILLPEETEVLLLASPLDELSHLELEALRTYALSRLTTVLPQQTIESLREQQNPLRASFGFLKSLMSDRRSPSHTRRNGSTSGDSHTGYFGLPIDVARNDDRKRFASAKLMVPYIVQSTVAYLKEHGPTAAGIFRISGSSRRVRLLRENFENGQELDVENVAPSDVASVLKAYLRALPEPLLMRHLYTAWADVPGLKDESRKIEALRLLCCLLPDENRRVLQELLDMLHVIAAHAEAEDGSKMTSHNLALVIAPNIIRPDAKTEKLMRTMSIERQPAGSGSGSEDRDTPPPLEREIDACETVRLLIEHQAGLFEVSASGRDQLLHFHMESSQNLVGALLRAYGGRAARSLQPPSPALGRSGNRRPTLRKQPGLGDEGRDPSAPHSLADKGKRQNHDDSDAESSSREGPAEASHVAASAAATLLAARGAATNNMRQGASSPSTRTSICSVFSTPAEVAEAEYQAYLTECEAADGRPLSSAAARRRSSASTTTSAATVTGSSAHRPSRLAQTCATAPATARTAATDDRTLSGADREAIVVAPAPLLSSVGRQPSAGALRPPAYPGAPGSRRQVQTCMGVDVHESSARASFGAMSDAGDSVFDDYCSRRQSSIVSSPGGPSSEIPSRASIESLWDTPALQPSLLDELARAWDKAVGKALPYVADRRDSLDRGTPPAAPDFSDEAMASSIVGEIASEASSANSSRRPSLGCRSASGRHLLLSRKPPQRRDSQSMESLLNTSFYAGDDLSRGSPLAGAVPIPRPPTLSTAPPPSIHRTLTGKDDEDLNWEAGIKRNLLAGLRASEAQEPSQQAGTDGEQDEEVDAVSPLPQTRKAHNKSRPGSSSSDSRRASVASSSRNSHVGSLNFCPDGSLSRCHSTVSASSWLGCSRPNSAQGSVRIVRRRSNNDGTLVRQPSSSVV